MIAVDYTAEQIERYQMADQCISVGREKGLQAGDEGITILTTDLQEFAGCYVVAVSEHDVLIGVS